MANLSNTTTYLVAAAPPLGDVGNPGLYLSTKNTYFLKED